MVAQRNARGGRSAQEYLVAALRCLHMRAVEAGLIRPADDPAQKVAKPRRLMDYEFPARLRWPGPERLGAVSLTAAKRSPYGEGATVVSREIICLHDV